MIKQHLCLKDYDWCVDILYDVKPKDAGYVLDKLYEMGCSKRDLYEAEDLLISGVDNQGLTFSDKRKHHTLMVIGHASSIGQLLNSISHEKNHLEMHVCEYYGIDPHGETASYLSGDIAEAIFENAILHAKNFLYLL